MEYAAVSAQKENKDTAIQSPEAISASELAWQIISKDEESWKLSWSISLTNNSRKAVNAKVQVLFLDKSSLALDDHTGRSQTLAPGATSLYQAATSLSPDLASRVHGAVAVVTKSKK